MRTLANILILFFKKAFGYELLVVGRDVWMFQGDSAGMCTGKFPLMSMGGQAEGLACAEPGRRTPIGVSGNC